MVRVEYAVHIVFDNPGYNLLYSCHKVGVDCAVVPEITASGKILVEGILADEFAVKLHFVKPCNRQSYRLYADAFEILYEVFGNLNVTCHRFVIFHKLGARKSARSNIVCAQFCHLECVADVVADKHFFG